MIYGAKGAIATNEVNAATGIICAMRTAGSRQSIPGVIFQIKKKHMIR